MSNEYSIGMTSKSYIFKLSGWLFIHCVERVLKCKVSSHLFLLHAYKTLHFTKFRHCRNAAFKLIQQDWILVYCMVRLLGPSVIFMSTQRQTFSHLSGGSRNVFKNGMVFVYIIFFTKSNNADTNVLHRRGIMIESTLL